MVIIMSKTISAQLETLEESHSPLVSRTANVAHSAVDTVASKLLNTEERLRNVAAESSQLFNESQERARVQMKKSLQNFKLTSQKNPLVVAGAALVVGAILAGLFRRN